VFYKYRCAAARNELSRLVKFLLIAPAIPAPARGGRRRGGNNKVFGYNSIPQTKTANKEFIATPGRSEIKPHK